MLPHRMLERFTQIDYDREIALVALCSPELNEKMLGVARIITDVYNRKHAEFSVIVGDSWQGKGRYWCGAAQALSVNFQRPWD